MHGGLSLHFLHSRPTSQSSRRVRPRRDEDDKGRDRLPWRSPRWGGRPSTTDVQNWSIRQILVLASVPNRPVRPALSTASLTQAFSATAGPDDSVPSIGVRIETHCR